jgi:SAM-dependent methyltransferase
MQEISSTLREHYKKTFLSHGATSKGVDWGDNEITATIRQNKMLEVIRTPPHLGISLLDVGCGYGALADIVDKNKLNVSYTGIDLVEEMIAEAIKRHPDKNFKIGDILETQIEPTDYVICNGILTQKLSASTLKMNEFAQRLIKRMFDICTVGLAFNVMSTFVNFQKENLYYRNPVELAGWCMSELTPHVRLDCAYKLWYEYTIFLYKKTA